MLTRFSLNLYTNNVEFSAGDVQHVFVDVERFLDESGFNFPTARIVCCEVERGIYIVERSGGQTVVGADEPEVLWFIDNIDVIADLARAEIERVEAATAPTWEQERNGRLLATDWIVQRHTEQLLRNMSTDLSTTQFDQLLEYRQQLRDAPRDGDLPAIPTFISGH